MKKNKKEKPNKYKRKFKSKAKPLGYNLQVW